MRQTLSNAKERVKRRLRRPESAPATPSPSIHQAPQAPAFSTSHQPGSSAGIQYQGASGAVTVTTPAPWLPAPAGAAASGSPSPTVVKPQITQPSTISTTAANATISTLVAGTPTPSSTSPPGTSLPTAVAESATLWQQALDKVQNGGQGSLGPNQGKGGSIHLIRDLINEIEQKKKEHDEKRWFYINKEGEKVFFVESLLGQLNKYARIGDIAIQHHPDIVALAWAGFRFLLQVGTAYTENMRTVSESLDYLVRILCCYDIYEKLYSGRKLGVAELLNTSLVNLYVSILEYLLYAKSYLQKDTSNRVLESFFSELGQLLSKVQANEKEAKANIEIADKEVSAAERFDQERRTKELKGLLSQILQPVENIERGVEKIYELVKSEKRIKILEWLSTVKFRDHHAFSSGRRQENTGFWLLENQKFLDWRSSDSSSILWLRGDAGSGKTILASFVIDEFHDPARSNEHVLAYFYCDYKQSERRDPGTILSALVKQFCLKNPGNSELLPMLILSVYKQRELDGNSSGSLKPKESRDLIVSLSEKYLQTTIVIDALDECDRTTRRELFSILNDIVTLTNRVKIFLTSRYDSDIEEMFTHFPNHYLDARDNSKDINNYIDAEIEKRCDPKQALGVEKLLLKGVVDLDLKSKIISTLKERAGGMFMWVHLQILALCEERTPGGIENALDKLPKDLDATYTQILSRIESQSISSSTAKIVLNWLLYTQEPCSASTINEVLAVRPGETTLNKDVFYLELSDILSMCQNLVVHDDKLQNLQFAHFSVKEFLQRQSEFREAGKGHTYMAEICLTALLHHNPETGTCPVPNLHQYSVFNWGDHVRLSGPGSSALQSLCREFLKPSAVYRRWVSDICTRHRPLESLGSEVLSPLWVACFYQLHDILSFLLNTGENPNACNRSHSTPLSWAAACGHEKVVQLLLERDGVDVDSKDKNGQTPLSWAAENGREKVVQLLLERDGVDVDSKDSLYGRTPLSWAAARGREKVVQLLLERDVVDVDSKDKNGRTPLSWAAENGHEKVVQLLLERDGVDVDSKDSLYGRTPLSWAAARGREKVVQLLLERDGVDVDSKNTDGQTPLLWAAAYGREKVVQLLLERDGVDVDSKDTNGRTPLSWAAEKGQEKVVQLLLERDVVAVDSKDKNGRTPRMLAAARGHEKVVQLLLERDVVAVDSKDKNGRTPLSWAVKGGYSDITRMLEKAVLETNPVGQPTLPPS